MSLGASLRLFAFASLIIASPLAAQRPVALQAAEQGPRLLIGGILDDEALESAVRSGLPLRMRFRLELWRDGFIDDLVEQATWSAVVAFEPLEGRFLAAVLPADTPIVRSTWAAARAVVEGPYAPALRPSASGRFYYLGVIEVETLSLSDVEELERWLRGDLEPAVRGGRSVGGAIGTGLKRLFIRILGLPARRYEVRSAGFVVR